MMLHLCNFLHPFSPLKVYTEAGTTANKFLTDDCINQVHDIIFSELSDGKYYDALKEMTTQYK